MDSLTQIYWALSDTVNAALIGLNLVPVLLLGLIAGLAQDRRLPYIATAIAAAAGAVVISALWPQIYGVAAIWPDPWQPEAQIQAVILLAIAYALVRTIGMTKAALPPFRRPVLSLSLVKARA